MRKPCGLMVLRSLLQLGVVLGVDAHGVKVARSLVMVWRSVCALGVVLGVVDHGARLLGS